MGVDSASIEVVLRLCNHRRIDGIGFPQGMGQGRVDFTSFAREINEADTDQVGLKRAKIDERDVQVIVYCPVC
jgi:hypothetical protein